MPLDVRAHPCMHRVDIDRSTPKPRQLWPLYSSRKRAVEDADGGHSESTTLYVPDFLRWTTIPSCASLSSNTKWNIDMKDCFSLGMRGKLKTTRDIIRSLPRAFEPSTAEVTWRRWLQKASETKANYLARCLNLKRKRNAKQSRTTAQHMLLRTQKKILPHAFFKLQACKVPSPSRPFVSARSNRVFTCAITCSVMTPSSWPPFDPFSQLEQPTANVGPFVDNFGGPRKPL